VTSIFLTELWAIYQTTFLARDCKNNIIIFSDTKRALDTINNNKYIQNNYIIYYIRQNIPNASKGGIEITLFWVLFHSDIPGNEKVDKIAKQASTEGQLPPSPWPSGYSMRTCSLNQKIRWKYSSQTIISEISS